MSDKQERKGTMYAFATIGARTERGGYVTHASSGLVICGLQVALVGDIVSYRDGSTLDNRDMITDSPERQGAAHRGTYEPVTEAQIRRGSERV